MLYWISLCFLFISIVAIVVIIIKKRIIDDDMKNDVFGVLIIIACILLSLIIPLSIDIPSALSGGKEIYVNELPTNLSYAMKTQKPLTDNKELQNLKGVYWNIYEKYGNYRIRYTEFTKFVLEVKKLD